MDSGAATWEPAPLTMFVLPDDAFVQLVSQSDGAAANEHELNSGMVVVVGLFDSQELLH